MATLTLTQSQTSRRYDADTLLTGDNLGRAFHQLFDATVVDTTNSLDKSKLKIKVKKKGNTHIREKLKAKKHQDRSLDKAELGVVPDIEVVGNPSSFAVYSSIRQTVLTCLMQRLSVTLQHALEGLADTDSDEEDVKTGNELTRIPKIVGVGLISVFELIHETQTTHPSLCHRSLQALFDILQGQPPEGLRAEPAETIDSLYQLLMELAQTRGQTTVATQSRANESDSESLSALACSCLISLVIARGDTGKLLTSVAAMLMFSARLAKQEVKIPRCLTSLQQSVQAVLVGRVQIPDWLTHGIPQESRINSAILSFDPRTSRLSASESGNSASLASDGRYLYLHSSIWGLMKVGTGYGNTVMGHIYASNASFHGLENGRLVVVKNQLLYKSLSDSSGNLVVVNSETLQPCREVCLDGKGFDANAMFSDGENIGYISPSRDIMDCFVVRMFNPFHETQPAFVSELPLKLARKCLDVFGTTSFDLAESAQSSIISGALDEDAVSIHAGKDFALMRTSSGKILYTGKAQALGLKPSNTPPSSTVSPGGAASSRWTELPIVKAPKIVQYSVGHEGTHCLLVTEDGSVFFVGAAKRGEDGDTGSLSKARRQTKAVKPKKMIRIDGKVIVSSACNSGSSAVVTQDGEVHVFGKDTLYCDHVTGVLTDMKGIAVTSVNLGKAHGVLLTSRGQVYTFGLNNKGQCGRDFSAGAAKELFQAVTMADEEEYEDDIMCPPGKHHWLQKECMICTVCEECTGYGSSCINTSSQEERVPGQCCGCGSGDSGCGECGACRTCAGETIGPACGALGLANGLANGVYMDELAHNGEEYPADLADVGYGHARRRAGANNADQKRGRAKQKHLPGWIKEAATGSDHELDHMKLASLPPGRVDLDGVASQVACGLHHTVVLMDNGDVYTFGSNQYGQLGVGDTNIRGSPCRVAGIKSSVSIKQVAAGCNHTVLMSADGQVFTFGNNQKGQLGRVTEDNKEKSADRKSISYLIPRPVPGIGAKQARRATWIGASCDQTFIRIDESLINAHTLARSNIIANYTSIGLVPTVDMGRLNIKCLMINRTDGSCRSFCSTEQMTLVGHSVCLDPVYDNLWSYNPASNEIACYNVIAASARSLKPVCCDIISPEYAMPVRYGLLCPRSHCAVNLLGCLDTLTTAQARSLTVSMEERERQTTTASFTKDDYLTVNRFESYGGGWGYSGHSIEAIRFCSDTDVLLGGIGLFGGRGEYFGKVKLYELGPDAGDNEGDGEIIAETDELPYRCSPREKFALLFDDPILLQANIWYVAWARISGPSSDCGSSGLTSVTTDDQIVFKFKNSKKSNNGTDTNAGQIPQLFYRLPTTDSSNCMTSAIGRKSTDCFDQVHILSAGFSKSVSPECFESLLGLLSWSWSTFCMLGSELPTVRGSLNQRAAILDLEQLVYISSASLRLICTYICEVYPAAGCRVWKSCTLETPRLAECVGEARLLLRQILSESSRYHSVISKDGNGPVVDGQTFELLRERILDECHNTFIGCFHAFYPTANLKWICLCELLASSDPSRDFTTTGDGGGRLLAAILEALCQMKLTKLTDIIPLGGVLEQTRSVVVTTNPEPRFRHRVDGVAGDDNKSSAHSAGGVSGSMGDAVYFPMLVGHMLHQTEMELVGRSHCWTFRDILDRLLTISGLPLRCALGLEKIIIPSRLVYNACWLIATLVGELAQSASGTEVAVVTPSRPLLSSPNRFGRTSQGAYWNSGNGNPDAVCFSVDRPGIVIGGAGIYGGGGNYEYELELLEDMDRSNDPNPNGRWNTLELVKGVYGPDECVNDIAGVKFEKPVPIKENVKYAIRLRNRGQRTRNGDIGMAKLKCSDGTVFSFSSCTLSSNGTNHSRGQIPTILYYSTSPESQPVSESSHSSAVKQARKNIITIVGAVFKTSMELIRLVHSSADKNVLSVLQDSASFSMLIPMVCAYISPVVAADPSGAVQILEILQEILAPVTSLCVRYGGNDLSKFKSNCAEQNQYCAVVESDHPYKPSSVHNYRVKFPSSVRWLSVEFDPHCGTAQPEDCLQLYIPARSASAASRSRNATEDNIVICETLDSVDAWWPVLKKYSGTDTWPSLAVLLPGSEVSFSLETASDYVKDEKACFYGFRCTVIGYEWPASHEQGLFYLEHELSSLGASCASALMKKDIILPPASADETDEDIAASEASVKQEFITHSTVLGHGLSLLHPPTIVEALDGNLAISGSSSERSFLLDFIDCTPNTSGGRLASWLQPESYIDPKYCVIQDIGDDLWCSWPVTITVLTKDQYNNPVHAPKLKVEVSAVPVMKDIAEERKMKRLSRFDTSDGNLIFGGHPPPRLDIPYSVTIKDNRDSYHAICIMKAYENYSFEELRYATPATRRPSENMLIRDNVDGTYSATWTPACVGHYNIQVKLDGCDAGEAVKVTVLEAPHNVAIPPVQQQTFRPPAGQFNKLRKFVASDSAGLRVRLHPSLQSEQIGVITLGGIISFTSETQNDDGVWLRLSAESVREFCSPLNGHTEGWALQYNQHLGKTLLALVEDTRQFVDDHPADFIPPNQTPYSGRQLLKAADKRNGYPIVFTAVKCGTSGHNVRVAPSLDSTAIGMVVVGNQLTATRELPMSEGMWLQLDKSSTQSYCHDTNGDAWCLARSVAGEVYLRSQVELEASTAELDECALHDTSPVFGNVSRTPSEGKGFDFTSAARNPVFSAFSNVPLLGVFGSVGSNHVASGAFGMNGCDTDIAQCNGGIHVDETVDTSSSMDMFAHRAVGRSSADPLGKARSASLRRESTPYSLLGSSPGHSTSPPPAGGFSNHEPVSGLVRQNGVEIKQKVSVPFPDLPPELQGVSVKDLVKALGESRVNGNGVTPPMTPPGTPKKTLSRSSSPRAPAIISGSPFRETSSQDSRQDQSAVLSSVLPLPVTSASVSPSQPTSIPSLSTETSWMSRGSVRAPALGSPSIISSSLVKSKGPLRSASSSPQRIDVTTSTPRALSSSPIRVPALAVNSSSGVSDTISTKDCFKLGVSPRKETQKTPGRKERSRVSRSKRDRASSPGKLSLGVQLSAPSSSKSPSHPISAAESSSARVRQAMSPSVSICMRAVFASFVWHEGIMHDAMACASFLKFHPSLIKDVPKQRKLTLDMTRTAFVGHDDGKCSRKADSAASDAGNMNETVRKACHQPTTENILLRERQVSTGDGQIKDDLAADGASSLPETLRYLVLFWEELSQITLKVVEQNLISPSVDIGSSTQDSASVADKMSNKAKSSAKKSKDGKMASLNASPAALALRGNLFGAAAGRLFAGAAAAGAAEGGVDKEMPCELCGGSYAHPVTYHMRQMHPGCGLPAGGQGYNSGGNFCGGWAGNCGDGGLGGSTWYLMCEKCRSRYLSDKRKGASGSKEKTKKITQEKKRPSSSVSQLAIAEPHIVLRNNAMFILELTDGTSSSHILPSITEKDSSVTMLPVLTEDGSCMTESAFGLLGQMPFLYLDLCGAHDDDSLFANADMMYCQQSQISSGPQLDRSYSVGSTKLPRSRPLSTYVVQNGSVDKAMDHASAVGDVRTSFQRSVSEMGGIGAAVVDINPSQALQETALVGRRRNNSVGDTGGMSLLKRPSADMSRLIKSTERASDLSESIFRQPVVSFVTQRHDLDTLRRVMSHAARRAACRTYALQLLNWLVRNVAHPGCLHHLLWNFVSAMHVSCSADDENDVQTSRRPDSIEPSDVEQDVAMCSHPLTDVMIAGEAATQPLVVAFHSFLQTVADVMMHVPLGSTLQRIAVRCWSLRFRPLDHMFLHRCHVFSNISQILSKTDDKAFGGIAETGLSRVLVECLQDLTAQVEVRVSSRQAMVGGMTDGSTETFWESGDEDKNKNKVLSITCNFSAASSRLRVISLHIDNARDLGNKVTSVSFSSGPSWENMCSLRNADVDARHAGWVSAWVSDTQARYVRIELKGPDNSLRIRQIKLLGEIPGTGVLSSSSMMSVQQKECEAETLSVFRLLTSLVFGQLVSDSTNSVAGSSESRLSASDVDLKEHMVGILFSRSGELTKLQRQVCSHIVGAIRRETARVRISWQQSLNNTQDTSASAVVVETVDSDAYCFELLSLVLALSGSAVGRRYVAQQFNLIEDLVSLLHTASPRVQRQIIALVRRILPDITPRSLATILGVGATVPSDMGSIVRSTEPLDRRFVLDVFLACIAKSLTVHLKLKTPGVKTVSSSISIASCSSSLTADLWWLRGSISSQLAETMILLLTDMVAGKLGSDWASVTKVAIATPIIGLSRLSASKRSMDECVRTTTLWLALSALCVLGEDHVDQLSTGRLSASGDTGLNASSRPMCANHDDDETLATVLCTSGCGSLCSECDRILHLSKKFRLHQRQVFKEEEESIRVDLHEGCGRIKLFWLLALADSKTLKAAVEFRQVNTGDNSSACIPVASMSRAVSQEHCRFCGASAQADLLLPGAVCSQSECMEFARNACSRVLPCGHLCGGIRDELRCLPCLHGCRPTDNGNAKTGTLRQDGDDMCMICFADALSTAPVILLDCGHAFHWHCCRSVLERRWPGPRITFAFMLCPICKRDIGHPSLEALLAPARTRREDVRRKALMRLEYEGALKSDPATGSEREEFDSARYAMERYAYYVCHKCGKAYYGGEARCEQQAAGLSEEYDPSELVCGACSDVTRAQMCVRHGADFLEYKCRYCCSVAVFFCFGTTHFCGACHDDFQRVTTIPRPELPQCPAGPRAIQLTGDECPLHVQHPATGEEFALGCGVCRNAHTF